MNIVLAIAAAACAIAALVWGRYARKRYALIEEIDEEMQSAEDTSDLFIAKQVARRDFRKELHGVVLYGVLAVGLLILALQSASDAAILLGLLVLVPAVVSISWYRVISNEFTMVRDRNKTEIRRRDLNQEALLAPEIWASSLAPEELPDLDGFEVGRVYQAGKGLMAGDFFDVVQVAPSRVAAVIGDVRGKGMQSSIMAFQAKYLLRVFLRQFRDPAQALKELNEQMGETAGPEDFISLAVVLLDTKANTLRYSSAGHPVIWAWHEREVQPLRPTGPLLMIDPNDPEPYFSREIELEEGDMVLLYTDGLSEARRRGGEQFGEDRIAALLRRDPTVAPDVLCKSLLEAARNFAEGPVDDDVAIVAVKRV